MNLLIPITFTVIGDPKAQPRMRAFKNPAGQVRTYDPATAEGWKSLIAQAAKPFVPFPAWDGPVAIEIHFRFRRPKAHFTKKGLRPTAPTWKTGKPDTDNLEKALFDCLTQIGFWLDDGQACSVHVQKLYGDPPGATITLRQLQDTPTPIVAKPKDAPCAQQDFTLTAQ